MPPSLFPANPVTDARILADTIAQKNAGQPMRRLDVFGDLNRSADSGASRQLVSSSGTYGLTSGSYKAEMLELTKLGERLSIEGDDSALIDAVLHVSIFKAFFDQYRNGNVPGEVPAKSFLASLGIPTERTAACLQVILENGRATGLITQMAGAEKVLSREHAIEKSTAPEEIVAKAVAEPEAGSPTKELTRTMHTSSGLPSINVNLEIHLPSDTRPEVYEAIFSSMRKHLIDAE